MAERRTKRRSGVAAAALLLALTGASPAWSQPSGVQWQDAPPGSGYGRRPPEQWQQLPPEARQRMKEGWQRFQQLPPEDRERIQQRARQFRHASPEERFEMCARFRQERGYLPPRCLPK